MLTTYSFADFLCAYTGPGGTFDLSSGGITDDGITIAFDDDKATKTNGADGEWMYSLHEASGGTAVVRLQKTSPTNADLSRLYNFETITGANYGRGVITGRNPVTGDSFQCVGCGIRKFPDNVNAKVGGANEWAFFVGKISVKLGDGNPELAANRAA